MENQKNIISGQGNQDTELSQMNSDLEIHDGNQERKDQEESKYVSHSEQKPHQVTIVNVDGKQDRSSSENSDNYLAASLNNKENEDREASNLRNK